MNPPAVLLGRLTADPELRYTPNSVPCATFTIAYDKRRKTADGQWETECTTFVRCTAWRNTAEQAAKALAKGMPVIAVGELYNRAYETRDGEKRYSLECNVQDLGVNLRWLKDDNVANGGWSGTSGGGKPSPAAQAWNTSTNPQQGGFAGGDDEPPF
ncbi:single-stranded DNA-binding protein [Corynebacterium sp. 13CS0277]|uniref:single-stranded DNA-binding protein n=1 Tax=Corynebacterium sp. 13CS0277 TaxID=2071994 RepID=UPI001304DF10|nr:single-stranded DNA-binding protein [Corynebacterium sp. 13CS0277]